jgi:hypothetical protein
LCFSLGELLRRVVFVRKSPLRRSPDIGDPSTDDFQDAVILAQFGEVDLNALSELGTRTPILRLKDSR